LINVIASNIDKITQNLLPNELADAVEEEEEGEKEERR
jgi:hypothetical protein